MIGTTRLFLKQAQSAESTAGLVAKCSAAAQQSTTTCSAWRHGRTWTIGLSLVIRAGIGKVYYRIIRSLRRTIRLARRWGRVWIISISTKT